MIINICFISCIKKGLSWTPMLYMYIRGVFLSSVGEARQVAMVMIIDVRKIITGNLSRCFKKEPDTITTGVTSRKREKNIFIKNCL